MPIIAGPYEGDHLTTAQFIRRAGKNPELELSELINGVIFIDRWVTQEHGSIHAHAGAWLGQYTRHTPGCDGGMRATWIMGPKDAPLPDAFLRIDPSYGGQSSLTPDGTYGKGAPELIVEVTTSACSRDLGPKVSLYRRCNVREYVTFELYPRKVTWRQLVRGRYRTIEPDGDGCIRSNIFPGLWLQPSQFWKGNATGAVKRGVKSAEHAAFVKRLAAAHKRR